MKPLAFRISLIALALAAILLTAPIWILWCPGAHKWRDHAYCTLLYGQVAQRVAASASSQEEVIERIADYVQTHLWTPGWAAPYDGTSADHLIRGIGWCDYEAKLYAVLLATLRIPARYAMLMEADGNSPHTVAEVWREHRWGVHDISFNLRFKDRHGQPLSLEQLSEDPGLLEAQPGVIALRSQQPDRAQLVHGLYGRVLPLAVPPRRSHPGTDRLTVFDHLLLSYARAGGPWFVAWYQDRYLTARPSAGHLTLARHLHLAGRWAAARQAYLQCATEGAVSPVAAEACFWRGTLEWEAGNPAAAIHTLRALVTEEPNSPWTPMAWYYMGRSFEDLGDPAEARTWYVKALILDLTAWFRLMRLEQQEVLLTQNRHATLTDTAR